MSKKLLDQAGAAEGRAEELAKTAGKLEEMGVNYDLAADFAGGEAAHRIDEGVAVGRGIFYRG